MTSENIDPFTHTRAALQEWNNTDPERQKAWRTIKTESELDQCQANDAAALALVQNAFYQDTYHINSMHHCRLLNIIDICSMLEKMQQQ